jgi:hypothetical protein
MHIPLRALCYGAALTFAAIKPIHAACGAAGCAINTNWETQGAHLAPGWRVDLRFEYVKQDSLRQGSSKAAHAERASGGSAGAEHDERETLNRNARVHADYSFDDRWGVSLDVPIIARKHRHIELDSGATEKWNFTALGDVRVLGRYAFGGNENMSWGLTFGAKLPTGKFDETNDEGERAERSLQPGSGTTDALLGAFYRRGNAASPWSWFGQVSLQQALNSRDGFKPGRQIGADIGMGYRLHERVTAMLQMNLQQRARDKGKNAEPEESGGEFAFLSPGIQVRIGAATQAYAFVQLPVYRHVNGRQLTAEHALLVGLSHRF